MSILLKRNDKTSIPEHFIIFDTETYPEQKEIIKNTKIQNTVLINQHFLSFGYAFYYERKNNKYYKVDECYFEQKEKFTEYVLNHIKKGKTLYVFAHNESYDFRVIFNQEMFTNADFKLKIAISDKVFIYKYGKKNFDIVFLSTTNYFKTSLKELGKTFNIEKLEFKMDEIGREEIKNRSERALQYCYRDVEILEKVCIELFNFMYGKCKFSFTIASTSFNIFRHMYYDENIIMHKDTFIESLERNAYFGGLTICFIIGKFQNIYKLDINSMYPDSMLNHDYPVELVKYIENGNKELLLKLLKDKEYLIIANVKVNIEEIKVPYKKNGKLIYPIGIFSSFLCQPELELLEKDEILEVKEILLYKKAQIFNRFVEYFYKMRLQYKTEKNEIMQYFCKIVLNSLYGKFAQRVMKENRNNMFDNLLFNGYLDYHWNGQLLNLKFIKGECFEITKEESGYNTFISISAFVTSYSRVHLLEMIKLVKDYVIYCDTDSLFVTREGYKILKENEYIDKSRLGKLKLEDELVSLETRNLKDYSDKTLVIHDYFNFRNDYINGFVTNFKTEHKIKGIKKSAMKEALKNGENISLKNEWKINRFLGFNESLRFFNLIVGDVTETKELKRTYEKGIVDNKGIVHPFYINEDNE